VPLRTHFSALNCSLARALDQLGDPWSLLILRECATAPANFEGLRQALGVARNILAGRLRALVENGLLAKTANPVDARGALYALTRKGADAVPALVALMQWGDRWISGRGKEPVLLESAQGYRLARVVLTDSSGAAVDPQSMRFRAGPGAEPATRAHLSMRRAARTRDVRRKAP
jgi:DNA-binding HxlR family transcriptional regulator